VTAAPWETIRSFLQLFLRILTSCVLHLTILPLDSDESKNVAVYGWGIGQTTATLGEIRMKRANQTPGQGLDPVVGLFRLLSDKTRLNILMLLADGERNVSSLCDDLKLPQPTVSHHLGLLRMQNLIANRRDGKQVFYGLNGRVNVTSEKGLEILVEKFILNLTARE
jgi:DNA-binding transcriptional ArsR family regulator